MVSETSEKSADRSDGVEPIDFQMPSLADDDLLDDELLEYALGESAPASVAVADAHLADCLFCRIRLNRIKIQDPRLEPPAFAVSAPPVSEEALKLFAADSPASVESDQVWYARSEDAQLMVWVSHEPLGFFGTVMAHPVTVNIDAVDHSALIVALPKIGPVAVFSAIVGLVPKSKLVAHLGDLDIASDLWRLYNGVRPDPETGHRTGRRITDPNDERIEFIQFLADQLADLYPIIEHTNEDDDSPVLAGAPRASKNRVSP